jgi:ribose transport system substrate-binding protein
LSGLWRGAALLVALAVMAFAVVGCGGGGSSSSGTTAASPSSEGASEPVSEGGEEGEGVSEAMAAVEKGSAEPKFTAPGPAFKVASGLEGQTIWYVANGLNFPFSENLVAGVKEAAGKEGMKVVALDGAGQPAKAASMIQQGIAQNVAAIVIQAFPTEALVEPIKEAKAAGIPVIQINDSEPGLPSATAKAAGVVANVASCYSCGGEEIADLIAVDTEGNADVVFVEVPDIKTTVSEREGFEKRMGEVCPGCKVTAKAAPVAQWGNLATLTSSALKSDPEVNYLVPALDSMVALMKPAVFASGASDKVHFSAYNATQPNIEMMQKGELVGGLVGNPEVWIAWGVVDEVLRATSGQPPLADEKIPNRIFTEEVAKGLDPSEPTISWYGEPGFKQGYEKLWE